MPRYLTIRGQKNQEMSGNWPDLCSSLTFAFAPMSEANPNWLQYSIEFKTPTRKFEFHSENFLLCLQPSDELAQLCSEIKAFLASNQRHYRFEPVEPNFELLLEKDSEGDLKLTCWIDNGNADCSHYTWDALGIRLYVDSEELLKALEEF